MEPQQPSQPTASQPPPASKPTTKSTVKITWPRNYRHLPTFESVKFGADRPPETPFPQDPFTAAPADSGQNQQPTETRPLAAAPTPARFYTQYRCPICADEIGHQDNANYIGNLPCTHRGPCTKPACVRAYYGTNAQWASPYRGRRRLVCQASGCGHEIEGWCLVESKTYPRGTAVFPRGVVDPVVVKEIEKEEADEKRERTRRYEEAHKQRVREDLRVEKMRAEAGKTKLGDITGGKCLDCCLVSFVCFGICCPCLACAHIMD